MAEPSVLHQADETVLITRDCGLPLNRIHAGVNYKLMIRQNFKGGFEANYVHVKITDFATKTAKYHFVCDLFNGPARITDAINLQMGVYTIDAMYYDKITNVVYDHYRIYFTVVP